MKPEQKMAIVFSVLGVAMGALSSFLGMLAVSIVVPIAAYIAMVFAAGKMESGKKMKWVVTHSLPSFVLVWIIVWIFVFNL